MSTKKEQPQSKRNTKAAAVPGQHVRELTGVKLDSPPNGGHAHAPGPIAINSDISWVTKQIAIGSAIRDSTKMAEASRQGITHILNLSRFDNTKLAKLHGIRILCNYLSDDLCQSHQTFSGGA